MADPYNFTPQAPQVDYDLERLKRALANNAQAAQGLEQMQPDLDIARDRATTQIGGRGGHWMQALADATKTSRGEADLRELRPQESAYRADIAEGESQKSLFNIYNQRQEELRAAQGHEMDIENLNTGQNSALEKQRLDKEQEARAQQNDALQRKLDSAAEGDFIGQYYDPTTDTTITVARDPKTGLPIDASTQQPVDLTNMELIEDDSADFRGKSWTPTQTYEYAKIATQTRQVKEAIASYKPEYSQIQGVPTGFYDAVAKGLTTNDLMKFINKDTNAAAKEAMLWWADWTKLYTLPERYKAFGATLTTNELKSWAAAEMMNPGQDGELTRKRMQKLGMDMENEFLNLSDSQLSTVTPDQMSVIQKNTKGLGTFNPRGEFGAPTIEWPGKEAFINGTTGEVVVEDKAGNKPPIVFPKEIPISVVKNLSEEDTESLRGLSDSDMVEILVELGLMADPRGQTRGRQGGQSVLPMSNPAGARVPDQRPSAIDTFGGEG